MTTPVIYVKKRDRCSDWLTVDMLEDAEVEAVVVIPMFGPNHNAGFDCWCKPNAALDGAIVHNVMH